MGYPDNWTECTTAPSYVSNIGGHLSDSTRYRMLGNSVAVPVVEWILKRIAEALGEPAKAKQVLPAGQASLTMFPTEA
jgi:site-specific DNA-cytosine methylase